MNAVYQITSPSTGASISIAKDLIFGWCMSDGKQWCMLSELDTAYLKTLRKMSFPAWVSESFFTAVKNELSVRKAEKEAKVVKPPQAAPKKKPDIHPNTRDVVRFLIDACDIPENHRQLTKLLKSIIPPDGMVFTFDGKIRVLYDPRTETTEKWDLLRDTVLLAIVGKFKALVTSYATIAFCSGFLYEGEFTAGYVISRTDTGGVLGFYPLTDISEKADVKALRKAALCVMRKFW